MPVQFYDTPGIAGGGEAPARSEIATPRVVTGAEAAQAAASLMDAQTKRMQYGTSLIDQAYNRQLAFAKAQVDNKEALARGNLYQTQADNWGRETDARIGLQDAQAANLNSESENRKALGPLQVEAERQRIRSQGYLLDEAGRQNDLANKAWGEVDGYRKDIGALDWQDPDIDSKIAAIRNKYPDAHTYAGTESQVAPVIQDLYARRGQSTKLQYNAGLMAGLERMQQPDMGLISPNVDVRQEVINGNGTALMTEANRQAASKRLQRILAEPTVGAADKQSARGLLNQINAPPGGAQPFGVDGALNTDVDTQIGGIERRYGITPQYPNAKMTIKREPNKETGKMETHYEISGMPPTAEDIEKARGAGEAGAAIDYTKDPLFGEAIGQINSEPGDYKSEADRAKAVWDRYNKLHTDRGIPLPGQEAAQQPEQPPAPYTKPAPGQPAPTLPVQPRSYPDYGTPQVPRRRRGTSMAEQPAGFELAAYEPGAEGAAGQRVRTSNNDYAFPAGAGDVLGINRNVWANVMSEEGPGFGLDPGTNHMSVFGLWADAPGDEGAAYRVARQYGANSPEAFNAVTAAWTNVFLRRSEPWRLDSPGLQEMVIADSQHVGGNAARRIINEMGGYDAINRMNPAEAIRTYAELRLPLWRGNAARVGREMNWALRHDATLRGGEAQPAPAAATVT